MPTPAQVEAAHEVLIGKGYFDVATRDEMILQHINELQCIEATSVGSTAEGGTLTFTGTKYEIQCRHCNQVSESLSARTIHERTHTGEKPYSCRHEGCSRAFAQSNDRTLHERAHTGEKPYSCRHKGCSKAFAQSSNRAKHERTHTGEKPYSCRHKGCSKAFTHHHHRTKHERTMHV